MRERLCRGKLLCEVNSGSIDKTLEVALSGIQVYSDEMLRRLHGSICLQSEAWVHTGRRSFSKLARRRTLLTLDYCPTEELFTYSMISSGVFAGNAQSSGFLQKKTVFCGLQVETTSDIAEISHKRKMKSLNRSS